MFMYLHSSASESGIALRDALDISSIKHKNSHFKGSPDKVVINWGCSELPYEVRKCQVINKEAAVLKAINKIWAFREFSPEICVPFTTDRTVAQQWVQEGHRVAVRTRLTGADGEGLVLSDPTQALPMGLLYTKFIQAEKEYRITVVDSQVIGKQRKVHLDDAVNPDPLVKTTANGWGFKWVTRNIPEQVLDFAVTAVNNLGLDFGGVDVVWDGTRAWVLEVNTAPHLTPIMVTRMAEALKEYRN